MLPLVSLLERPNNGSGGRRRMNQPGRRSFSDRISDPMGRRCSNCGDDETSQMLPEDGSRRLQNQTGVICQCRKAISHLSDVPSSDNFFTTSDEDGNVNTSEKWLEDFSHRPSWCDAAMSLQQIEKGKAEGFKWALRLRSVLQKLLFRLGKFIQWKYGEVLFMAVLIMCFFCIGLRNATIELDIVKLWVEQDGPLQKELTFLSQAQAQLRKQATNAATTGSPNNNVTTTPKPAAPKEGPPVDTGINGGFQLMIQTPRHTGQNILTRKDLLLHAQVLGNISSMYVQMYGEKWYLHDLCFKPPAPPVELGAFGEIVNVLLDKIIPCIIVSPLDCFWDGAKALGPFPPIEISQEISMFLDSLEAGNITWKNLNPTEIINEVGSIIPLGDVSSLFERAGLGAGYLDRPCIDPLEPECPKLAPNYISEESMCEAVNNLMDLHDRGELPMALASMLVADEVKAVEDDYEDVDILGSLFGGKRRRRRQTNDDVYNADDYYDTLVKEDSNSTDISDDALVDQIFGEPEEEDSSEEDYTYDTESEKSTLDPRLHRCHQYRRTARLVLLEDRSLAPKVFGEDSLPQEPDYARSLTGGCQSFARDVLVWAEQLVVGGIQRKGDMHSEIETAEALQSVFLVANGNDVFNRFKNGHHSKPKLNKGAWSIGKAHHIVQTWQRKFTKMLYNWPENLDGEAERQIHPLASTSITDMLAEFSEFKYNIILVGYLFMLLYAGGSLYSWNSVDSCAGLGMIGVLLVTFASASGLGLSSWCGIDFNAATTQIVPFLTLGLGVDDMFLLVHNYQEVVSMCNRNELGYLLKETGLSVLLTSINNILAFMAGGLLPVPALRSFCIQTAILLFFNVIAILTIYPAIMALDLKRRRRNLMDPFCCLSASQFSATRLQQSSDKLDNQNNNEPNDKRSPPSSYEDVCPESGKKSKSKCSFGLRHLTLHHFVKHVYIPLLQNKAVKVSVIVSFVVMTCLGAVGLSRTTMGLDLSDVIAKGTAPHAFLVAREKYFSFYPMYVVIKGPIDFARNQDQLRDLRNAIGRVEYTVTNNGNVEEPYWMLLLSEWLVNLESKLDKARERKRVNETWVHKDETSDVKLARKLICSVGDKWDCSRLGRERLVDENGKINEAGFYNYLTAWYNVDSVMVYVAQANFVPPPPHFKMNDNTNQLVRPARQFIYSQIPFYLNGLVDSPATIDAIKKIRAVCEEYTEMGVPNFPQGIAFTFWDQYLHLGNNLLLGLGVISGAVFVVITVLLMNPWTAGIIVLVLAMMVLELAGFMGIVGLKLNAISAVSLITAVGIGVEFTVHVSLCYLTSLGDGNSRMAKTLNHMFIPVVHGGLSTLLGIIMLAFSDFEFIVRYFFMVMTALIILGLLNGLLLLPVLLSFFGPPCEVRPVDGSDTLPPPTPKPKRHVNGYSNGAAAPDAADQLAMQQRQTRRAGERKNSLSTIREEPTPTPPPSNNATAPTAPAQVMVQLSETGSECDSPVTVTVRQEIEAQVHQQHSLPRRSTALSAPTTPTSVQSCSFESEDTQVLTPRGNSFSVNVPSC